MAELALSLSFLSVAALTVEGSSSAYHRIQVGGPANQITTGEIRIDLPSQSFQNLKFNITPYSLQNEYSPYYDQYTPGYKPSAYTPPKQQTYKPQPPKPQISYKPAPVASYKPAPVVAYKPAPVVSYKPAPVVSYKPAPVVSYKPSPSIVHPVYSFTRPKLVNSQPSYHQPKITYSQPAYTQPNVIFTSFAQTKPSVTTPKASEKNTPTPTPAPEIVSSSTTSSPVVYINNPPQAAAEGYYGAYSYPYQQSSYTNIKSVVDLKGTEEVTEAAPVEEVTEVAQSEDEVSEKAKTDYETIFRKFVSYGSEPVKSVEENVSSEPEGSDELSSDDEKADDDEPRKPKTIDTDADTSNLNSINSVESATLLPEFVPVIIEEGAVSPNTEVTPTQSTQTTTVTTNVTPTSSTVRRRPVTSFLHDSVTTRASTATSGSSSIRRRPVTSVFHDSFTTTIKQTTTVSTVTPTTRKPITTTKITTTAKAATTNGIVSLGTTSSNIRRRPVVSVFHDVTSSTPAPAIEHVTPPGQIGQNILDKMRAATLTVETILETEEEITLTPENNNDGESITKDENDEGEVEQSRERRKVVKVRKPKSSSTFEWPSTKLF